MVSLSISNTSDSEFLVMVDMGKTISKIAFITFLFAVFVFNAAAQSGRKPEKPTKPTPPATSGTTTQPSTPPPDNSSSGTTTTTSSNRSRPSAEKTTIVVADDGSTKSDRYAKTMVDYFVARLDETQASSTSYVGQLKKSQAAARAKTENGGWVVYVEIHVERFGSGMGYGQPDMTFNYIVYRAGSDQEVAKGKVKMQGTNSSSSGRGPLGIPQPVPTSGSGKSTPEETGRAAADQVMIAIQYNTKSTK